ncbi:U3 small nucleolar RNA-associated protein 18 homolog wicked [Brevipalpus obovatus]|uniref:U3 small nucleolar RNA-associated protein 18 homolog wicked n=1 Tax=Brevipalpus obovatus TaxID=246614 RepID=UPI003D9E6923
MAQNDSMPLFILDRTGDSTAVGKAVEKSDSSDDDSDINEIVNKRLINRAKRKKHLSKLDVKVFGEDLSKKIGKLVQHSDDSDKDEKNSESRKEAAWIDVDDDIRAGEAFHDVKKYPKKVEPEQSYRSYLVEKFTGIYGQPRWVKKAEKRSAVNDSDDDEDGEKVAYTSETKRKGIRLEKDILKFTRCACLNLQQKSKGVIASVQFHPSSNLALTAAANGNLNIFQVDGDTNASLQNLYFENFPVDRARFTKDGNMIVVGSKPALGYFFTYDMVKGHTSRVPLKQAKEKLALREFVLSDDGNLFASRGKDGNIHLFTMNSRELVSTFKLNEEAHGLSFDKETSKLFSHSDEGAVYVFDIRHTKRCYHRFIDQGSLGGRSLAIAPNQSLLATGDQSGLVNFYQYDKIWNTDQPKPVKSLVNLKTPIECLKFNHTSEMMAVSSGFAENAVRIVHSLSQSVFSNFPQPYTQFKRITEVDFSPNSGYLTFANNRGTAFLSLLNHYIHY